MEDLDQLIAAERDHTCANIGAPHDQATGLEPPYRLTQGPPADAVGARQLGLADLAPRGDVALDEQVVGPLFQPVDVPVFCGVSGWYLYQGGDRRDTDWYEINTTEYTIFTWTAEAEFDCVIGFLEQYVPGVPGCDNITGYLEPYAVMDDCVVTSIVTSIFQYVFGISDWQEALEQMEQLGTVDPAMMEEITAGMITSCSRSISR